MMKYLITIIMLCVLGTTGCNNFNMQPTTDVLTDKIINTECKYDDFLVLRNCYPHDKNSFTQGLFFYNNELYESTGLYGSSKLIKNTDIKTGKSEMEYLFESDIFAEGSVVFKNNLYVLTYKEKKVMVFDPKTLELKETLPYNREGWGLTTDGTYLIASDGTSKIYYMDENLNDIESVTVTHNGKEINRINELEYIDGYIWANEWLTNNIIITDKTGNAVKILDFSNLKPHLINDTNDVLNGIAYNKKENKIYITGKRWDTLYELEFKK